MKKICTQCKNKMRALCKLDGSRMHWAKCGICKELFCDFCLVAGELKVFLKGSSCKASTKFKPSICYKCYKQHWWRK